MTHANGGIFTLISRVPDKRAQNAIDCRHSFVRVSIPFHSSDTLAIDVYMTQGSIRLLTIAGALISIWTGDQTVGERLTCNTVGTPRYQHTAGP